MAELQRAAATPRFGTVEAIRGSEFVAQVTEASGRGPTWVVCLLYKDSSAACQLMGSCIDDLARKYPGTKFVRIVSTDAIPNYPDTNLPTLLLYHNGACKQTLVGLQQFGGRHVTPEQVALVLNGFGPVCAAEGQDERAAAEQAVCGLIERLATDRADRQQQDESSDFED
jgi:hypothetical protein